MAHLGDEGTPPVRQLGGLGDMPSGLHIAGGIAAGLFVRERTGIAQRISLSLLNSAIWTQGINIQIAREYGSYPRANRKTAANPLANGYEAKDGKWIMLVMLQPDRRWPDFCKGVGLDHLIDDPRFTPMQNRYQNREELIAILDRVFATKTRAEWIEKFKDYDLQWDPVNTFNDLIEDPQALANDDFAPMEHPTRGLVLASASPIRFSKTPASVSRHAPELGEQTEEILLEMGYAWEQIAALKEAKAII